MLDVLPLWAWLVAAFSVGTVFGVIMMGSILRESRQVQLTDRIVTMLQEQQEQRHGEKTARTESETHRGAGAGHGREGDRPPG